MVSGVFAHFRQGLALKAAPCFPVRRQQDLFFLQQCILQESADSSNAASACVALGPRRARQSNRHVSRRSKVALRQSIPWLALTFKMKIPFP
jgi:hypothetical protein